MRRYLYVAIGAASALLIAAPTAQAGVTHVHAATATHVLTVKKLHGKAVKPGAVLKASLKKGTTVTIALAGHKMICKKASFAMTVATNPAAKGKATGTVTSEKISRCKLAITGLTVTVTSIVANNLPYNATVSDSKGDPVTVSGTSGPTPISLTANITVKNFGSFACTYTTPSSTGHASNKHHTVTFSKRPFTTTDGPPCLAGPAKLTVTFGPIVDSSVSGSPTVYIN